MTIIDQLHSERWHGSRMIKGIQYQMLYSIHFALESFRQNDSTSITLEGIEDLDFKGLISQKEYIQVKTSNKKWQWNKFVEVVNHFVPIYLASRNSNFYIIINNDIDGEIKKIINYISLSDGEKKRLEEKVFSTLQKQGLSESDIREFICKIHIKVIKEDELHSLLLQSIDSYFNLVTNSSERYRDILIANFIEWSIQRLTITNATIKRLQFQLEEIQSKESVYSAIIGGLVQEVSWSSDANNADYYQSRGTRVGHIVNGCDIPRRKWLEVINKSFDSKKLCIVIAASGQGKSSLLYRYALDYRGLQEVYVVSSCRNHSESMQIIDYLKHRKRLGLPMLIVIDDINWDTQEWCKIASGCIAFGANVLIGTRVENWIRFPKSYLPEYEIVEPIFDFEDACAIYDGLLKKNMVDDPQLPVGQVFDTLDQEHLLIEFVNTVTNGKSLRELLREQLSIIGMDKEAGIKIDILRLASTAHILESSIDLRLLKNKYSANINLLSIIESLNKEYITIIDHKIYPLHLMRSQLISEIIHESTYAIADTIVELFELIPEVELESFIIRSLRYDTENVFAFLSHKVEQYSAKQLSEIIKTIFVGGEETMIQNNISVFNEAYAINGHSGVMLLAIESMPTVQMKVFKNLIDIFDRKNMTLRKLQELSKKISSTDRGIDLVRQFLTRIDEKLSRCISEYNEHNLELLYWIGLCQSNKEIFKQNANRLYGKLLDDDLSTSEIAGLASALYICDERQFSIWYKENAELYDKLIMRRIDLLELSMDNDILSYIIPVRKMEDSPFLQFKWRFKLLRQCYPHCIQFNSDSIDLDKFYPLTELQETIKHIPVENEPLEWLVSKNAVWIQSVLIKYIPKGYYAYLNLIYSLRLASFGYCKIVKEYLYNLSTGHDNAPALETKIAEATACLNSSLLKLPSIIEKYIDVVKQTFPESMLASLTQNSNLNSWAGNISNFKRNLLEIEGRTEMAVNDYRKALELLPKMQDDVNKLMTDAPTYFDFESIDKEEIKLYNELNSLFYKGKY